MDSHAYKWWRLLLVLGLVWVSEVRAFEIDLSKIAVPTNGDGVVIASLSITGVETVTAATFPVLYGSSDIRVDQFVLGRALFSLNETLSGSDGRWGRVVALKLRPGEYRFGMANYAVGNSGKVQHRSTEDLKRTFVVEPNKVLYLGNLDVLNVVKPGVSLGHVMVGLLFGLYGADAQARPHVRDMWAADLKVIQANNPDFDAAWVEKRLMRDTRDDTIEATIAEVKARADEGQTWAQAAWAEASVLGYASLPDLRYLRLPSTLAFNAMALNTYIASAGDPGSLAALAQWVVDQPTFRLRAPLEVDGTTARDLVQATADRYAWEGAKWLVRDERFGVTGDANLTRVWKQRQQAVVSRGRLSATELLEVLIGTDATQQLADTKGKRKLVAMTPQGRHFIWASEGEETLEAAAAQLIQRCVDESGETCWITVSERNGMPPICSGAMYATGRAQSYPLATLTDVSEAALTDKPWADAYRRWQAQGRIAEVHPRSMVWDSGLQQGFTAAGDCLASLRATTACKARGGLSCQLVVQDDKLMPAPDLTPPGKS